MKRSSEILLLIMVGLNVLLGIGNITFFFTTWNRIDNPIIITVPGATNSTREPMIYFGDWDIEEIYIRYEFEWSNGTYSEIDVDGTFFPVIWVSKIDIFSSPQYQKVFIANLDFWYEIQFLESLNYSLTWINIRDFRISFGTDFWSNIYEHYRIDVKVIFEYIGDGTDHIDMISHLGPLPNGYSFERDGLKPDRCEYAVILDIYLEDLQK